jgi:uncharacterized protein YndB with AHSA1/START domain
MDNVKVTKDLANKTLTVERLFKAPKEKLWRAYADKDWFVQWWGPEGWETTVKEFDFQPGGRNHYGMKCVDQNQGEWFGQTSWGLMNYETIDEPNSLSYKDLFANEDGKAQEDMPTLTMTIKLVETDGQTNVISIVQGDTAEDIEKVVQMGMVEGYASSADRLEQLVNSEQ